MTDDDSPNYNPHRPTIGPLVMAILFVALIGVIFLVISSI
jgi:hypothetical protein